MCIRDSPYNYNGMGYNGKPAEPDKAMWSYNIAKGTWSVRASKHSTMDHRGLLHIDGGWFTVGGMKANQVVTHDAIQHL